MTEYTPRVWSLGEVCQHGSLGRQCETCRAEHERDWALAEVERLRKAMERIASLSSSYYDKFGDRVIDAREVARAALEVKP